MAEFSLFNLSSTFVRGLAQVGEEVDFFLPLNVTKRNILSPWNTHTPRSPPLCAEGIKNRSKSAGKKRNESGLYSGMVRKRFVHSRMGKVRVAMLLSFCFGGLNTKTKYVNGLRKFLLRHSIAGKI